MSTIRYLCLPLVAMGFLSAGPALGAKASLGEAVRAADAKYLKAPEAGAVDKSPEIIAGGGEDGLPPSDGEVSLGRVRVTLTYVEDEPDPATRSLTEDLPGEADDVPAPEPEEEAENGEIPPEDIPEDATLPGEFDIGETVSRAPVVTVYFDDPNQKPSEPVSEDTEELSNVDLDQPQGSSDPEEANQAEQDAGAAKPEENAEPIGPRVVARLQGPSTGFSNPPVSIQIAELDAANPYPEVVVSFFTGGAHCCSITHVVTSNADGTEWTTLDAGEFDGGPMLAVDLDGDGTLEFEVRDNNFLYAFACYACSEAPLQILAVEDGSIKNVSAAPRFQHAHAAWLRNMIVGVPEEEVNGFLAGYVAQKARLGEGKQAWDLMLKYFDRNTDWGLEYCEQERDENGECPGEPVKTTFPKALERMLNKNGYKIAG
jgi:hypothetical protein